MNQHPNQASQEETLTRFIDGELSTHDLSSTPEWLAEKAAAQQVGHLLRTHLHARQEPISPEFFTSQMLPPQERGVGELHRPTRRRADR